MRAFQRVSVEIYKKTRWFVEHLSSLDTTTSKKRQSSKKKCVPSLWWTRGGRVTDVSWTRGGRVIDALIKKSVTL
jgi:hypothetical protein